MATHIWVNIDSGNGLFPDSTKPLPVPMLIYHQFGRKSSKPISQEIPHTSITKISLSITCQKFHSNLPWANEFVHDSIWSGLIKAGPAFTFIISKKLHCRELNFTIIYQQNNQNLHLMYVIQFSSISEADTKLTHSTVNTKF